MKKLFAILVVAGSLTACNNSGEKKDAGADTAAINNLMDSAKNAMDKMMDSASSSINNLADSAKGEMDKMADSASKKIEEAKPKM